MNHSLAAITIAAALGSGLVAGVFFAFSNFVMPALARTTSPHGAEATQHINRTVINGWFLGTFLGTGVLCLLVAGTSLWWFEAETSSLALGGVALYVIGTIGVTVVFNVPMNETLASMPLDQAETTDRWRLYLARWTLWNTVRTVAATSASLALILSLLA